jgi:hypothetical protein
MIKRKLLLAALAASSIWIAPLPASADTIYLDIAPPAPRYEVAPAPRAGYVWQPGVWEWTNGQHHWRKGYWVKERHGYYYHPSRWEQRDGRWYMEHGRWDRQKYAARGDRDHDGVPNAYDHDRDGDGVPNRVDRAPDNPHRY